VRDNESLRYQTSPCIPSRSQKCAKFVTLRSFETGVNCLASHLLPRLSVPPSHSTFKTRLCLSLCLFFDKVEWFQTLDEKSLGITRHQLW